MTDSEEAVQARRGDDPRDLSKFQVRILAILNDEERYGLAVKRELEDYYDEDVNHGRLYPNLDDLIEAGLVEKWQIDKRTNGYRVTDAGRDALLSEVGWLVGRTDQQLVDESVQEPTEERGSF